MNLEDETGLVNVVVSAGCWLRHRDVVAGAPALVVRGRAEVAEGPGGAGTGRVVNVAAERIEVLEVAPPGRSRDLR